MGKIGEIRPSDEIEGKGSRKFRPEAEILVIFSIEVAPYLRGFKVYFNLKI